MNWWFTKKNSHIIPILHTALRCIMHNVLVPQVKDQRLINYTYNGRDTFHKQLERKYYHCPNHDVKIVIGVSNAQVGQKKEFRRTIGKIKTLRLTIMNDLRLIVFTTSKNMTFLYTTSSQM